MKSEIIDHIEMLEFEIDQLLLARQSVMGNPKHIDKEIILRNQNKREAKELLNSLSDEFTVNKQLIALKNRAKTYCIIIN